MRRSTFPAAGTAALFAAATALALLAAPLPAGVEPPDEPPIRYLAFGDSVTLGAGFDDCDPELEQLCGYPVRVKRAFRAIGIETNFINLGRGGERTPDGIERLERVLGRQHGDFFLLMEGTNDISREISPETTLYNLDTMAAMAEAKGIEAIHATLIPRAPFALIDPENAINRDLVRGIRGLAIDTGRQLVDPFEVFSNTSNLFDDFYFESDTDPVGHPDEDGFDLLADVFFDVLTDVDRVAPVPVVVEPADGSEEVPPLTPIRVRVADFQAGLDLGSIELFVGGLPVVPQTFGDPGGRWLELVHAPPGGLAGVVTVSLAARDLVGNTRQQLLSIFTIDDAIPETCIPNDTVLCIDDLPGDRRFEVTLAWETNLNGGQVGNALALPLESLGLRRGGLFSFFDRNNPEVLVKVLDGCGINGHFWVFGAPTTTIGYELRVVDTLAGRLGASREEYELVVRNEDGTAAEAFSNLRALPTCEVGQ